MATTSSTIGYSEILMSHNSDTTIPDETFQNIALLDVQQLGPDMAFSGMAGSLGDKSWEIDLIDQPSLMEKKADDVDDLTRHLTPSGMLADPSDSDIGSVQDILKIVNMPGDMLLDESSLNALFLNEDTSCTRDSQRRASVSDLANFSGYSKNSSSSSNWSGYPYTNHGMPHVGAMESQSYFGSHYPLRSRNQKKGCGSKSNGDGAHERRIYTGCGYRRTILSPDAQLDGLYLETCSAVASIQDGGDECAKRTVSERLASVKENLHDRFYPKPNRRQHRIRKPAKKKPSTILVEPVNPVVDLQMVKIVSNIQIPEKQEVQVDEESAHNHNYGYVTNSTLSDGNEITNLYVVPKTWLNSGEGEGDTVPDGIEPEYPHSAEYSDQRLDNTGMCSPQDRCSSSILNPTRESLVQYFPKNFLDKPQSPEPQNSDPVPSLLELTQRHSRSGEFLNTHLPQHDQMITGEDLDLDRDHSGYKLNVNNIAFIPDSQEKQHEQMSLNEKPEKEQNPLLALVLDDGDDRIQGNTSTTPDRLTNPDHSANMDSLGLGEAVPIQNGNALNYSDSENVTPLGVHIPVATAIVGNDDRTSEQSYQPAPTATSDEENIRMIDSRQMAESSSLLHCTELIRTSESVKADDLHAWYQSQENSQNPFDVSAFFGLDDSLPEKAGETSPLGSPLCHNIENVDKNCALDDFRSMPGIEQDILSEIQGQTTSQCMANLSKSNRNIDGFTPGTEKQPTSPFYNELGTGSLAEKEVQNDITAEKTFSNEDMCRLDDLSSIPVDGKNSSLGTANQPTPPYVGITNPDTNRTGVSSVCEIQPTAPYLGNVATPGTNITGFSPGFQPMEALPNPDANLNCYLLASENQPSSEYLEMLPNRDIDENEPTPSYMETCASTTQSVYSNDYRNIPELKAGDHRRSSASSSDNVQRICIAAPYLNAGRREKTATCVETQIVRLDDIVLSDMLSQVKELDKCHMIKHDIRVMTTELHKLVKSTERRIDSGIFQMIQNQVSTVTSCAKSMQCLDMCLMNLVPDMAENLHMQKQMLRMIVSRGVAFVVELVSVSKLGGDPDESDRTTVSSRPRMVGPDIDLNTVKYSRGFSPKHKLLRRLDPVVVCHALAESKTSASTEMKTMEVCSAAADAYIRVLVSPAAERFVSHTGPDILQVETTPTSSVAGLASIATNYAMDTEIGSSNEGTCLPSFNEAFSRVTVGNGHEDLPHETISREMADSSHEDLPHEAFSRVTADSSHEDLPHEAFSRVTVGNGHEDLPHEAFSRVTTDNSHEDLPHEAFSRVTTDSSHENLPHEAFCRVTVGNGHEDLPHEAFSRATTDNSHEDFPHETFSRVTVVSGHEDLPHEAFSRVTFDNSYEELPHENFSRVTADNSYEDLPHKSFSRMTADNSNEDLPHEEQSITPIHEESDPDYDEDADHSSEEDARVDQSMLSGRGRRKSREKRTLPEGPTVVWPSGAVLSTTEASSTPKKARPRSLSNTPQSRNAPLRSKVKAQSSGSRCKKKFAKKKNNHPCSSKVTLVPGSRGLDHAEMGVEDYESGNSCEEGCEERHQLHKQH